MGSHKRSRRRLTPLAPAVLAAAHLPVAVLVLGPGDVRLIDSLLGLGLLAVVPLAFALHGLPTRRALAAVACGAMATTALVSHPDRWLAVALGLPWLTLALATAWRSATCWWREGKRWRRSGQPLVFGYLAFAALWLLLHLGQLRLPGLAEPLIELTAAHFTFAGFTAGTLAITAHRRVCKDQPVPSALMVVSVLAGTPAVAVGFKFSPALQIAGAILLATGLLSLSGLTIRRVVAAEPDRIAARLLTASAAAVPAAMLLAVWWAVGTSVGLPTPSVPFMARTHGVLNAVGFTFLGVLGWRRLDAPPATATPAA
jgi:hypothetical protein